MHFSKAERKIIGSFLQKVAPRRRCDHRFRAIGFSALFRFCTSNEKRLLKRFLALHPRTYGFKGTCYGIVLPPNDLVAIARERIPKTTTYLSNGTQFLPGKVYAAYKEMNRAMFRDIGRRVFVLSGYRSPAYQLVIFLESLKEQKFNMKKTARRVALPGYSEHGVPKNQAIDFTTLGLKEKGADNPAFERSLEYKWLTTHAHEFGFQLSYPRGNKWGVMFEPWHWHYNPVSKIQEKLFFGGKVL